MTGGELRTLSYSALSILNRTDIYNWVVHNIYRINWSQQSEQALLFKSHYTHDHIDVPHDPQNHNSLALQRRTFGTPDLRETT